MTKRTAETCEERLSDGEPADSVHRKRFLPEDGGQIEKERRGDDPSADAEESGDTATDEADAENDQRQCHLFSLPAFDR